MTGGDSTVLTFVFTDIEGSTRRWEHEPDAMRRALERHDALLRSAFVSRGGTVFKHTGDGLCATFAEPEAALQAAVEAQRALEAEQWPLLEPLRARIGVHSGTALHVDGDYFGPTLNRTARIMAAGHGGQILGSGAAISALGQHPPSGLQLIDCGEHSLRDLVGVERIFQVGEVGEPHAFGPLRVLGSYRHNLPHQPSALIGRSDDVDVLVGLIRSNRLVTLTGIGGCGKTRLALRVAAEVLPEYPAGAWLVDLTVSGPAFVARAIAKSTGYGERLAGLGEGDQPGVLVQLAKAVGEAELLILLDNCEHVVQSAAECIAFLLQHCAKVRVLATSREMLRISGERVHAVAPLATPVGDAMAASVLATPAGELFATRASAVQPGFVVNDQNAAAVASICRRVDGLPLALELAAARTRMLSPQQIDERLADALKLLTHGDRTIDARHQTLLATLEWSHSLLSPDEQAVLRRLAIFEGGFTLDAAEEVCGFEPVIDTDVIDCLESLVDRSLVSTSTTERVRFRLLEVVRQFAALQLEIAGELEEVERRQFLWALALAQRTAPIERFDGTRLLVDEAPNLRVAFRARKSGRAAGDERLLLAYTLWRYMLESGRIPEGLSWLDSALEGDHTPGTPLEARALDAAGFLASLRGNFTVGRERIRQSLELGRQIDDSLAVGWTLLRAGLVNGVQGALDDTSTPFHEALDIFKREGYRVGQAWAHLELGRAYFAGDELRLATAQFEKAMEDEVPEDVSTIRYARVGVEACRLMQGTGNIDALSVAVADLVELQMLYTSTQGLLLACAASIHGRHRSEAAGFSRQALALTHQSGGVTQALHSVEWAAQSLAQLEHYEEAAALWGYVAATRQRLGSIEPPLVHRLQMPLLADLEAHVGEARLNRMRDESARLPIDDVVRLARKGLSD